MYLTDHKSDKSGCADRRYVCESINQSNILTHQGQLPYGALEGGPSRHRRERNGPPTTASYYRQVVGTRAVIFRFPGSIETQEKNGRRCFCASALGEDFSENIT